MARSQRRCCRCVARAARAGWALSLAIALSGCAQPPDARGPQGSLVTATLEVGPSQSAARPARVVLIAIGGLAPHHYGVPEGVPEGGPADVREGVALGGAPGAWPVPMPILARLARAGVYADRMESVFPATRYPTHATLVTGLRPDRHRLLADTLHTPHGASVQGMARSTRIQATTLWHAARVAAIPVGALNWPSTAGAAIDLLLPALGVPQLSVSWLGLQQTAATPWVFSRLAEIEPSLMEIEWPEAALTDSVVTRLACEIAAQKPSPGLWLLSYQQGGESLAREGPGSAAGLAGLARVDDELGKLIGCFEAEELLDSTAILVVGDRRLFPLHSFAAPNTLLVEAGLVSRAPGHLGHPVARWHALVRTYGGSAVVYAADRSSALLARRALDLEGSETGAFRVVPARELAKLHADPQAWFGLAATAGFGLTDTVRGVGLGPTGLRGLGGYLPGRGGVGFVAWGSGIRAGVRIPLLSQIDIAPTVAALLGFELHGAEGEALVAIMGGPPEQSVSP